MPRKWTPVRKLGETGYWIDYKSSGEAVAIPSELWEKYLAAQLLADALEDEIDEYVERG